MASEHEPLFPGPTDADFWGAVVIASGTVGLVTAIGALTGHKTFSLTGAAEVFGGFLLVLAAIYARMVLGRYLNRRRNRDV